MLEWVFDFYNGTGTAGSPPLQNNCTNTTSNRVIRGGSWYFGALGLRAAYRYSCLAAARDGTSGFRCARTPQVR